MITSKQYHTLDDALEYLNKKLFDGKLPDAFITFQRKPRMAGYHHFERLSNREDGGKVTEIALNPDVFSDQTDREILSILAHEMCHLWQHVFGEPSRGGYHNREWAEKMKEIGLQPSSTGAPGGKEFGQSMDHYIIDGGKFEIVCGAFLLKGNAILLNSVPLPKKERKKSKTREKYVCPKCMTNIWGKKGLNIACGECLVKFVIEEDDQED